ncbi:MAG: hypothetical protein HZC19_03590 [Candidatus Omnitrophica bacterium]|nr:hypothetical protein [Candidatus Omnitrophota bacterium]
MRTKFLTKKATQRRYIALLIASMLIPLVFVGGCLYYLIFSLVAEQLGIPESIAYNLFPVIKKINMILAIGIPPLFLILILWGIGLSHRFAGPIERLEKELEGITGAADYCRRLKVRKGDDIKPIADAINKLLDKIESKGK